MTSVKLIESSLDMLILGIVKNDSSDAFGIIDELQRCAGEPLIIDIGTLQPVLYRLEGRSLIQGCWRRGATGVRRMHYSLTAKGEARLEEEAAGWQGFVNLVGRVLDRPRESWA